MPVKLPFDQGFGIIRFGGGLNRTDDQHDINIREAVDGKNFLLKLDSRELQPRPGITLLGTATNGASIDGWGQLEKVDGERTTLIQAGTTVYLFDGASFTSVGTVNAGTKLRGSTLEHHWTLDDKLLLTDLGLKTVVQEWDGSTLRDMPNNLSDPFFAKYCAIDGDRAFFGNVISGRATPHVMVGSSLEDNTTLSINDRPSSALSAADPFFLTTPDLKAINGFVHAFDVFTLSSKNGKVYRLLGSDARDYNIDALYPRSATTGDETMLFTGSDILYARQGKIESLKGTLNFGDVENDDVSRKIANDILLKSQWKTSFDSRTQRVFFWEDKTVYVFHKPLADDAPLSAWSIWTTNHSSNFEATTSWTMFDPRDGIERLFFGDVNGNVYVFDNTSDAGTDIVTEWTTPIISAPANAQASQIEGWIKYRQIDADVTVNLTMMYGGIVVGDDARDVVLKRREPDATAAYYGGSTNQTYYNDGSGYGQGRLGRSRRVEFSAQGRGEDFQIKLSIASSEAWSIQEVGLRYDTSSA